MKKISKIITTMAVALVMMLSATALVGCIGNILTAQAVKDSLVSSGYTVGIIEDIIMEDDTKISDLRGTKTIFSVEKGSGDNYEYGVVIIFDSIENADSGNLSDSNLISIWQNIQSQNGANKRDNVVMGRHNNVVYACYSAIRDIAGLR